MTPNLKDLQARLKEAAEKATPGPWQAAAAPSSIVGWPIVAQTGRLICNLATPPKNINRIGKEKDRYEAFMAECQANVTLIALCSPENITALLARIEKLEGANKKMQAGLEVLATTFYKADQHQDYAKHVLDSAALGGGTGQSLIDELALRGDKK